MSATNTLSIRNVLATDKDIRVWGGDDAFTHMIVVGPTRCGKTSTILHPMAYEMMKDKKRGKKVGFTIIEPKGDLVQDIYDMAIELGLKDDVVFLDPTNPNSQRLNVMQGEEKAVVEATVAVLKSMFGKQEAFFSSVQEASTRNVVALLKRLYKDNLDIGTVLENLRDLSILKASLDSYKKNVSASDDVTKFVEDELLGTGQMAEKYRQLVVGLRVQLSNLISNDMLKNVITGNSDVDILQHLEEGKILLVNTAAGQLGKSGDAFGMFVSMHLQLATFRREGVEKTRIPHYLIIDEYSQYINPDVARFLSFAASYRVAFVAAIQSFSQLEVASGDKDAKTIRNAIVNTARNKIIFGGVEIDDAKMASEMMGAEEIEMRSNSYEGGLIPSFLPKAYRVEAKERDKFTARFFMDGMPRFHCVCKLVEGGVATPSFLAKGEWIPSTWRELARMEDAELLMSDEERLKELEKSKPSLLKFKERALIEAEIHEIKERQRKREQLQSIKLFDSVEVSTSNESSEYFVDAPKQVAPSQPIQQPVNQSKPVAPMTFSTAAMGDSPVVKQSSHRPVIEQVHREPVEPLVEHYTEPQANYEPSNPNMMVSGPQFAPNNQYQQNIPNGHSANNVQNIPPPVQSDDDFFSGLGFDGK